MQDRNRETRMEDGADEKGETPVAAARAGEATAISLAFEKARPVRKTPSSLKRRGAKKPQEEKKAKDAPAGKADGEGKNARRGNDLFRRLIEERKRAQARLEQQEKEYAALLAIGDMGESAEDVARQILFRRLVKDGSREKLEAALRILEEQEAALSGRLGLLSGEKRGRDADAPLPGTDFARKSRHAAPLEADARRAGHSPRGAFRQGNLHELIQAAESYFSLYRGEPGHGIRMRHIRQVFRDPARISEFLAIHEPSSWARQFQYLYDNVIIPASCYEEEGQDSPGAYPEEEMPPASTEELIRRNMARMGL